MCKRLPGHKYRVFFACLKYVLYYMHFSLCPVPREIYLPWSHIFILVIQTQLQVSCITPPSIFLPSFLVSIYCMLHSRSYVYVYFYKQSSMQYYMQFELLKNIEHLIRRFSGSTLISTELVSQLFRIIYNNKGNKVVRVYRNS